MSLLRIRTSLKPNVHEVVANDRYSLPPLWKWLEPNPPVLYEGPLVDCVIFADKKIKELTDIQCSG